MRFLSDPVAMEAVYNLVGAVLRPRHDRLRVPILHDGMLKQFHFRRRNGVWVVIVGMNFVSQYPLHAIDRLRCERADLVQGIPNLVQGINLSRKVE